MSLHRYISLKCHLHILEGEWWAATASFSVLDMSVLSLLSPLPLLVPFLTSEQGLAGWTGYGCYFLKSQVAQWRLCLALQVVPPLCLLIGSWWVPESPRYLVATDRQEAGFAILKRLHHHPDDEDDTIAREELYQIRRQLDLEKRDGWRQGWIKGWILLFSKKSYRKRLLFGFLLL
jgi:hypothetical protein